VYNELFLRVPDHPQNVWKADQATQRRRCERQLGLLRGFLRPESVYLEVGAGDCYLAMAVAGGVRHAYAVDVSEAITRGNGCPANFSLLLSDGTSIPVPTESVDVAYSNQLLEHLHPDDAVHHLQEVYRALAPGGVYICATPHRFSGPQDVSGYFEAEATGFHLKEYTYAELRALFRRVGFACTRARADVRRRFFRVPETLVLGLEASLGALPRGVRKRLANSFPLRPLFRCIIIVGWKGFARRTASGSARFMAWNRSKLAQVMRAGAAGMSCCPIGAF
jgi:SAM-dependent methyltransferase